MTNEWLRQIRQSIMHLGQHEFTTAELIRWRDGAFRSCRNTPPAWSANAIFGRTLSRYSARLGIAFVNSERIRDDVGHPTSTARWRVV